MTLAELIALANLLQAALDIEQQQVVQLQDTIVDLQAELAAAGTEAERQTLADLLNAIKNDLEGTVPGP